MTAVEYTTERAKALENLRQPFPPDVVGILPKPYKKDSPKGNCDVCGGYHGLPAVHLDFVGHAPVTDRLLTVDPEWTWKPMYHVIDPAVMAAALASGNPECVQLVIDNSPPALDKDGNLWIWLTVCGITRPGVGDGYSMKERIGDALRNAAMRYGVALSLWTKDELESGFNETKATPPAPASTNRRASGTVRPSPRSDVDTATGEIAPPATGDVAEMSLQQLTEALQAAGLPLTGNTAAKRARLAEHRLTGSVGVDEPAVSPATQGYLPDEEPF